MAWAKASGRPKRVIEMEGEAEGAALRARRVFPRKSPMGSASHGKVVEVTEDESRGTPPALGHRHAAGEAGSPTAADGSDVASLPREWGQEQPAPEGREPSLGGSALVDVARRLLRRGFLLEVPCHWHCSRNGQARVSSQCEPHTRFTASHPARGGVPAYRGDGRQDSAGCHPVGGQASWPDMRPCFHVLAKVGGRSIGRH
jgi:hypothetical protein